MATNQQYKQKYALVEQNDTAILVGATYVFCDTISAKQNKTKYGSANTLFLANNSSESVQISFDGSIYTEIYPKTSLVINAEDGQFFNIVNVKNLDAVNQIEINELTCRYGRSDLFG